jgi:hypothetical protein
VKDHPWLKTNPVFALQPGMAIDHPVMQKFLAPVLDNNARIRLAAPIERRPRHNPGKHETGLEETGPTATPPDQREVQPIP